MLTLRERLDYQMQRWAIKDDVLAVVDESIYGALLDDLEEAVKAWLVDGAHMLRKD